MKAIERQVIRKRKALMSSGRRMFANAIKEQYEQALRIVERTDISRMEEAIVNAITIEPIHRIFGKYYSGAADIAMMWRKEHNKGKKSTEDDLYYEKFKHTLRNYADTKAGKRINDITKTTEEYIVDAVRNATRKGFDEGLGIDKVRNMIYSAIKDNYSDLTKSRAQLIAQTEMITASNEAAMEGTRSLGLEFVKFWSTSGIGNSRDSHVQAEQDSIDQGGLKEGELFSNGLEYPGDPNGDADEVCNCHCTLLTEIV
jgi:hypothetical protein